MQNNGELFGQRHPGFAIPRSLGDRACPILQARGSLQPRQDHTNGERLQYDVSTRRHYRNLAISPNSDMIGRETERNALPPDQIKALIRLCGRKLFESFEGPLQGEDQIFVLRGNFLEWHLNPEGRQRIGGEGETTFGTIPMSQLCDMIFQKKPFPRVLMINLTHLKRELGKALDVDGR
jgi:hypothetical protein